MYSENEPTMKWNNAVLNDLPGDLYKIEAADKIPDNFKYPKNTLGSAKFLK